MLRWHKKNEDDLITRGGCQQGENGSKAIGCRVGFLFLSKFEMRKHPAKFSESPSAPTWFCKMRKHPAKFSESPPRGFVYFKKGDPRIFWAHQPRNEPPIWGHPIKCANPSLNFSDNKRCIRIQKSYEKLPHITVFPKRKYTLLPSRVLETEGARWKVGGAPHPPLSWSTPYFSSSPIGYWVLGLDASKCILSFSARNIL